jgi:hypothetical protein
LAKEIDNPHGKTIVIKLLIEIDAYSHLIIELLHP